jgi:primosomal protein N' (replication factor Y) (superfamily II helicase)
VRVRTEVAAVAKVFDYAVPDAWDQPVVVGTRVRVPLHGRSVRGWVVEDAVAGDEERAVLHLKSWLGWGPPSAVVDLADWAAWRWAGPASSFLGTASPGTIVRALPRVPPSPGGPLGETGPRHPWADALEAATATVVRLPPATDLLELVLSTLTQIHPGGGAGSVLVLVPSAGWARRLVQRLVRRGWPATTDWAEARAGWPVVVGSRAGAWAPLPQLAAALVLDAHDVAYREESSPTYSAVDVVLERARRQGAPCLVVSPVPPVSVTAATLTTVEPSVPKERAGWPALERVDRRQADPRTGLFSEELVRLAHSVLDAPGVVGERGPFVCVYNRTGRARLLACAHCGELARCARCGAAAAKERESEILACPRCGETRPVVCAHCGRLRMKTLRAGVSRLREELAALLGADVGEVAGPKKGSESDVPPAPVLIGTEAVLHRVRRASAVAFLDIDLHLLAPRLSATEDTLALFVRAGRLVGGRGSAVPSSRVLVQTRVPDHPLLDAVSLGRPAPVLADEVAVRRVAGLPPFVALAVLSGALAPAYAESFGVAAGGASVSVSALADERFLLRAPDHETLCDLLAGVPRPSGRGLRVEVDPVTV